MKQWASKRKYITNKGKICKYPNCKHIAKVKGYCVNHNQAIYWKKRRLNENRNRQS